MSTHIINFPGADIHTTTITSVSNVSVGENLDVTSNLTVSGNTALSSNLFVTGNVGIGTTEPTESLDIVGNLNLQKVSNTASIKLNSNIVMELPKHDRPLVKYPEVAMTANSSGGYVASASTTYNNNGSVYVTFNEDGGTTSWLSQGGRFDTSSPYGANSSASTFDGIQCEWLQLQLPRAVKVSYFKIIPRSTAGGTNAAPEDQTKSGSLYGSNDGSAFTKIMDYGDLDYGGASGQVTQTVTVNASVHYKYLRLTCTARYGNFNNQDWVGIGELEYYGTEEGDESVDVVHRSIPNKPGQQHLEVYWDANDSDSYSFADSSSVYDLSGNGRIGTLTNNVTFDSVHNGWITTSTTTSGITCSFSVSGGDWVHSVSYWVKVRALPPSSVDYLFGFASAAQYNSLSHYIKPDGTLVTGSWTLDYPTSDFTIPVNEWFHVTTTYQGGGFSPNVNAKTYINGELKHMGTNLSVGTDGTVLGIPTSAQVVYLGYGYGGAATSPEATYGSFRMYNKALNADQVRELYEYDAPRFGHRQNLVSLHKGNLGVGVSHPTSRFEVAGDERIQEYPPRAMTGHATYMEGHGVFRVSASSSYSGYHPWQAFDKIVNVVNSNWHSATGIYDSSDGSFTGLYSLGGYHGEYIILEMPYRVTLTSIGLHPRVPANLARMISDGQLIGSNDGSSWESIYSFYGLTWPTSTWQYLNFTNSKKYKYIALVVTKIGNDTYLNIGEIKFFGTPGPTTLDKGSLSLTRSLDVPRVSRYDVDTETPRPEKLVVDFDTTVNSSPTDISGKGNHGTLVNGAAYSSTDRAFVFDGTNDYLLLNDLPQADGNFIHSVSYWLQDLRPSGATSENFLYFGAAASANQDFQIQYNYNGNGTIYLGTQDNWLTLGNFGDLGGTGKKILRGEWNHYAYTYNGTSTQPANLKFYMNGEEMPMSGSGSSSALSFSTGSTPFYIGRHSSSVYPNNFEGKFSNFKMYNVVLEPSEVKKLYRLGRTGRSMVISDTAVGIGKVPEAQLDVRGSARFGGIMSYSVPYYFAQQENTGSYAYDEPIVYETNVVTNYPGSFYSSATNNGYYIPPLPGVYQVHMTAIANGAGSIYIQKFNYVTDSVIMYHDKTHFNFTSGGWESISASGLISIDDPGTQAIRIFADGTSGNGIWAYNSYHGCVSIVWVSNI